MSAGATSRPPNPPYESSNARPSYTADEITIVKTWLVTPGQRLEHIAQSRPA
jgi:outer membrane receptor for Fe3+-dicitrate